MLGGIFALLSAMTFGFNNASVRRGVMTGTVLQALSITVPMGIPIFVITLLFIGDLTRVLDFPIRSLVLLSLAGIVHFVFGRYCNYRSTKAIGGNLSGAWKQSSMIFALLLAMIFLGEYLTPLKTLGIGLIIYGAVLTSKQVKVSLSAKSKPKTSAKKPTPDFEPSYREGYTFALLAAFAYGLSPVLISLGLANLDSQMSVVGGMVSYGAASCVVFLLWLIPGNWEHVRSVQKVSVKWFSLAAVLVGLSQMFRYIALSIAPVSVVTPVQSTSVVFRVLFSWLINREQEVFGIWVILGSLVSLLGVIFLVISADFVQQILPFGDTFQAIIAQRWP